MFFCIQYILAWSDTVSIAESSKEGKDMGNVHNSVLGLTIKQPVVRIDVHEWYVGHKLVSQECEGGWVGAKEL